MEVGRDRNTRILCCSSIGKEKRPTGKKAIDGRFKKKILKGEKEGMLTVGEKWGKRRWKKNNRQ